MTTFTKVPPELRQYITKSKSGHYSCVLKRRKIREGCRYGDTVLRTIYKHGSPQEARAEVLESLAERIADGRISL
jgi:hypothetical protein